MMPRKKRRMIIIVSILVVVLIIAATMIALYINTDMFKSNATLFTKYIGQNVESIGELYNRIGINEYEEMLKQNKYQTKTQVKMNYIEDIGTTMENTRNSINELKLEINGQKDEKNQYNYQDISLLKNNGKISEIEYIQDKNVYGIRFSNLFNQYLLTDKEGIGKINDDIDETAVELIDRDRIIGNVKAVFQFSKQEKENIKNKYIDILNENVSSDKFSKQANQQIQINEKKLNVDGYVLTLTKEQINNLYIKFLEEMKQDENILNKMDKLQNLMEQYQLGKTISVREQFVQEIDDTIKNIMRNNIGQEENKIIVYVNDRKAVKTKIQASDYEIDLDLLSSNEEDYIQVNYHDSVNEKIVTYKRNKEQTKIDFKDTENEETSEYELTINRIVDGNHCDKTISIDFENIYNKVAMTIEEKIDIVDSFKEQLNLENESIINLNELNDEQFNSILDQINSKVSEHWQNVMSNDIKLKDLMSILKTLGLVKEGQSLESNGISQTEKNRFNSRFEILQGDNLESDNILNLINAVRDNFVKVEVVSNSEIKLTIDRSNKSDEAANTLSSFVENNKKYKYNAKVQYDNAGLVNAILLTVFE